MVRLRALPYKYLVAAAFVVAMFMDILDTTIINVALPTLGRDFHAGNTTLEWIITGYLLSLAVWIPASGWIGDRFGTKKTFLFALTMFTISSALCGLSWNIGSLITFRVLQGVGGGMLTPVGMSMLYRAFPANERAQASAVLAVPTFIAPTLGPIVGGWLVTDVNWRWIFYINLPIGLLGILFTALLIKEHREPTAGAFDLPGFLTSGLGLALVLYALSRVADNGWTSPAVVVSGLAGIALFVALVRIELRVRAPMLDLRLFANRMFRNANLFMFVMTGSLLGVLFLLPLFLQQLRGLTALQSGLTTFPQAIGLMLMVQISSRLYSGIGPRRLMVGGLLGVAATSALFLLVGLDSSLWWVRGIMFLRGMTLGFCTVPMQAASFPTIKPQDTGRASALVSTNRQVGSALGVAVLATVLVKRSATHIAGLGAGAAQQAVRHATLLAFHDAFFFSVIFCLIGVGFAFLIHDEDAAASMRRSPVATAPAPGIPEQEAIPSFAGH